jgi:hypothetical protein
MSIKTLRDLSPEELSQVLAAAGNKATVAGGGMSFGGIIFSSQFIGLAGLLVALVGLLINWYYRHKEYQLKEREHLKRYPNTDFTPLKED